MNISCFGTGYVGLVTGACLADLGHNVVCVDIDEQKIHLLREGRIPFYEPGLRDVVTRNVAKGRLQFTTKAPDVIKQSDVIFNCVGTPSKQDGSADLTFVYTVAETIAQYAKGYTVLINKSTVPAGTAQKCQEIILAKLQQREDVTKDIVVDVVSNPEFLKEGSAVHDFSHPDKIVVGAKSQKAFAVMHDLYSGFIRPYMNILETDWQTSELMKYANNAFLATKISFINEIANIADKIGADIKTVATGLGMDYRISPKFLNAGIGYGGSCFPKDVQALIQTAKEKGYNATLLQEVHSLNERQKKILVDKINLHFNHNLQGKRFTLLGLSFKPKTSDIRQAPSLHLIKHLLQQGAAVHVYDPVAMEEIKLAFPNTENLHYHTTVQKAAEQSSALILATEWDEFRNINFAELAKQMQHQVVFDGRNIFNPSHVKQQGFTYYGIGRN